MLPALSALTEAFQNITDAIVGVEMQQKIKPPSPPLERPYWMDHEEPKKHSNRCRYCGVRTTGTETHCKSCGAPT